MREYSGNFDLNSIYSLPWTGRVVSTVSWQDNIESEHFEPEAKKGWGCRYRVRYFGLHSPDTNDIPDEQLPMANVCLPVTAGSGLGGFVETPALSAGSIVTGFFMDGPAGQQPYITGVMINSNNEVPKSQPKGPIGGGQLFNDTYGPDTPVPDFLQLIKPYKRASFASTEYKVSQQSPLTIDQLRARTAAREAAGPQVGDTVTDAETIEAIRQEQEIGRTGRFPGGN